MRPLRISYLIRPIAVSVMLSTLFVLVFSCSLQTIGIGNARQFDVLNKKTFDGFPGASWFRYEDVDRESWSSSDLKKAWYYFNRIGSEAAMLVHKGAVVLSWGDVRKKYRVHSIRKSFLFSLYGIHEQTGNIDLEKTIGELRISDHGGLSDAEMEARIIDLLKCRSGVYHNAAYETPAMRRKRPARNSHRPGEFYYYNNWDFNVLGTIFEQETRTKIFEEFNKRIALPLQMEDFKVSDGIYGYDRGVSIHPAYRFVMSTRDMARFGLLYLNKGKWKNQQIIDERWIEKSTTVYSYHWGRGIGFKWAKIGHGDLKAYGTYQTSGYRGHRIMVLPGLQMVFVHRVDTFDRENRVSQKQIEKLLLKIIRSYDAR